MVIRMGTDRETEVTETADQDTTKKTAGRREDSIRREYGFASDVELKECRYCRVMIPKKAKVCPNCRMSLKRHWFRNLAAAVFAVAVIGVGGFYLSEHWGIMRDAVMAVWMAQDGPAVPAVSVATVGAAEMAAGAAAAETSEVSVKADIDGKPETEEAAGQDSDGKTAGTDASSGTVLQEDGGTYEEGAGFPGAGPDRAAGRQDADTAGGQDVQEDGGSGDTVNGSNSVQDVSEGGSKGGNTSSDKASGDNTSNRIKSDRTEKQGTEEAPLDPLQAAEEPEGIGKDSRQKTEDTDSAADDAEDTDSAADDAEDTNNATDDAEDTDNAAEEKKDTVTDKNMDQEEKAFREDCITVGYKSLLRDSASYLDTALRVEVQVICQVNGGLFDENIYYLCMFEDKSGIERYYIIRDDREEDDTFILEGDTLTVYGRLFGSCRLPASLVETRPTVPAVSMLYYDLMEE